MRHGRRDRHDPWQFTLLDSVSARRNATDLVLGPPQRRAVLAVLLINAGRTVGIEQLIDAVWDDRPPGKAQATLQVHVSALRRSLEHDRRPHEPSRIIRSVDGGYLIDPCDIELDVFRFRQEVAEADQARTRGDLARATELLRSALDVFHTVALPGVPGPFAARHRDLLVEQRLAAYLDLVELNLLDQPDMIVDHDLTDLLAAHPYHERLLATHLRLLHHNGRRADALAAYAVARQTLVDDLGVEPGAELRRLHQRLLAGDTGGPVTAPRLVAGPLPASTADPELGRPPRQPWLLGQAGVLAELIDALTTPVGRYAPVVVLHGIAGMGKTAVAVWAAQETTGRFPGGRFFLPADADPEHSAAVLRKVERAGGALLIVDDVTPADVRPELPAGPDVTVLITSRSRCRLLPLARRIGVPPLRPDSAGELFRAVVGGRRCDREPDAVRRLVSASAGVPSVLLSLAELLTRRPEWSMADYADRLADDDGDWSLNVHLRPLFDRSYAELDQLQAKVFRMAALPEDRPPTAASIAAMTTWPLERVEFLLEDLVDRNLLTGLAPGEYGFPPLLHRYALDRALRVETADELAAARQRLAAHVAAAKAPTGHRFDAA